jgi:hypothetical protein
VPVLVPLAILRLEPDRVRRRWLAGLLALGVAVGARMLWLGLAHPIGAHVADHAIVYATDRHFGAVEATAYVVATCGAILLSTAPRLRLLGAVNVAGLLVAVAVRYAAVTSVWCLYAALASVLIVWHLRAGARSAGA